MSSNLLYLAMITVAVLVAVTVYRGRRESSVTGHDVSLPTVPLPGPVIFPVPVDNSPYFDISEFDSPDRPGSGSNMSMSFIRKINAVRHDLGEPMIVNSGFRSKAHNMHVGGSPSSSHMLGLAADIHCPSIDYMKRLVSVLESHGVKRIGKYKTESSYFVHFDTDLSKNQVGWVSGLSWPQ